MPRSRTALCLAIACLAAVAGCGRDMALDSRWPARALVVDGDDSDWERGRYSFQDVPITVGVANDDQFLYVALISSDHQLQMQVLMRGLELWLDPWGGQKSYFGVRFPGVLGNRTSRADSGDDVSGEWQEGGNSADFGRGRWSRDSMDPERVEGMFSRLQESRQVFVLDAPDEEGSPLTPRATDPLQVRLGYDRGRMVYEARVPLDYAGHPHYQIRLGPRTSVGLGLRVPESRMASGGRTRRGDMGELGGMGGGIGDGLDGMGGGARGMAVAPHDDRGPEGLRQWTKVRLAGSAAGAAD